MSDIVSKQGGQTIAHAGVQPDFKTGHIRGLWEMKDGQPLRQLAAYQHDEHGDLVQAQDEDGAAWHYRYSHHLVTRYNDRTGRGTRLEYDRYSQADGEPAPKAIREWADDGSFDTRLQWDPNIRLTTVTDALGQQSRFYCDIDGYTYRVIHPDLREEWFFRDDAKNLTRHVHPDGSVDEYRHDADGNLVTHIRADGSRVHFEYDRAQRLSGIQDPQGGTWRREHDPQGHLSEETDPLGHKTRYAHDDAGRPVLITDAKGGKSQLAYTPQGQLASHTDCSGRTTRWAYDERGRLLKRTDAAGHETTYRYTALTAATLLAAQAEPPANWPGQLETVIHADGSEEHLVHDAEGRLLRHSDPARRHTTYAYTAAGLIDHRIDAAGHRLGYRWDALGRLVELQNENGRSYRFLYNPAGQLLEETGFDDKTTRYRYDESTGVLADVIEGDVTTRLSFDAMGRLTRREAGGATQEAQAETFAYHPGGQLAEARNAHARLQWFYDAGGNLTREHHGDLTLKQTAVWHHRYNELNQRIGSTRPDGHTVEWLTYGSGHVHGLLLDGQEQVGFERDALHREVHRLQANGLEQHLRRDPLGRLLEQQLKPVQQRTAEMGEGAFQYGSRLGSPAAILRRYGYDPSGQLDHIEDSRRGRIEYRYDPVGRLLKATGGFSGTVETFAFDPAGNIVTPQPVAPTRPRVLDNLIKEYAGSHYSWDERGNLVERLSQGQRSHFEWDAFNRLVQATTPQGTTTFTYDPLGRRIAKRHEPKANEWTGTSAATQPSDTTYGWDGDTLAYESGGDKHRPATVHYIHEPGGFVPLLQARRSGQIVLAATTDVKALREANSGRYDSALDPLWNGEAEFEASPFTKEEIAFYQCDQLGTPQELTNHEGKVAWEANYKAWGLAKYAISEAAKKAGVSNNIRFQGQYFDWETGLHYNRYRYYESQAGRFVSKDPIGLRGGVNMYVYGFNPVEWVDPLGLVGLRTTDPRAGSLTPVQTRCWYLREESRIDAQICQCSKPKDRARLAHKLRNQARIRSRLLINDTTGGVGLYIGGAASATGKTEPMLKWRDAVAKVRAKGMAGDDVYKSIENSSQRSRASVNRMLEGINCDKELQGIP